MSSHEIRVEACEGHGIVRVKGYFSGPAAKDARDQIENVLDEQRIRFLFDFSECNLINSPGVVGLTEITYRIVEDFQGRMVITGLDDLKIRVLKMAGIFPKSDIAATVDDGLKILLA